MAEAPSDGDNVRVSYEETPAERRLLFERGTRTAVVAQNRGGYATLAVRRAPDGATVERYYGLEPALEHAAELLVVHPSTLEVPPAAEGMGV